MEFVTVAGLISPLRLKLPPGVVAGGVGVGGSVAGGVEGSEGVDGFEPPGFVCEFPFRPVFEYLEYLGAACAEGAEVRTKIPGIESVIEKSEIGTSDLAPALNCFMENKNFPGRM
jgi:hypothetical protein